MRLQMGCVDHHRPRLPALGGQGLENTIEDARHAPAHETVVEGLVWAVFGWRVAPHKAVTKDVDDARDDTAIIDPRHTAHLVGQQRTEPGELGLGQPEVAVGHASLPYMSRLPTTDRHSMQHILWVLSLGRWSRLQTSSGGLAKARKSPRKWESVWSMGARNSPNSLIYLRFLRSVALMQALAHNLWRGHRLAAAPALAQPRRKRLETRRCKFMRSNPRINPPCKTEIRNQRTTTTPERQTIPPRTPGFLHTLFRENDGK